MARSNPDAPRSADECVSRARMRWTQRRRAWMLALVDRSPSGDGDGPPAIPAMCRGTEGRPGPVLFSLDVDGQQFAIRRAGDGGTDCRVNEVLLPRWRCGATRRMC